MEDKSQPRLRRFCVGSTEQFWWRMLPWGQGAAGTVPQMPWGAKASPHGKRSSPIRFLLHVIVSRSSPWKVTEGQDCGFSSPIWERVVCVRLCLRLFATLSLVCHPRDPNVSHYLNHVRSCACLQEPTGFPTRKTKELGTKTKMVLGTMHA